MQSRLHLARAAHGKGLRAAPCMPALPWAENTCRVGARETQGVWTLKIHVPVARVWVKDARGACRSLAFVFEAGPALLKGGQEPEKGSDGGVGSWQEALGHKVH